MLIHNVLNAGAGNSLADHLLHHAVHHFCIRSITLGLLVDNGPDCQIELSLGCFIIGQLTGGEANTISTLQATGQTHKPSFQLLAHLHILCCCIQAI